MREAPEARNSISEAVSTGSAVTFELPDAVIFSSLPSEGTSTFSVTSEMERMRLSGTASPMRRVPSTVSISTNSMMLSSASTLTAPLPATIVISAPNSASSLSNAPAAKVRSIVLPLPSRRMPPCVRAASHPVPAQTIVRSRPRYMCFIFVFIVMVFSRLSLPAGADARRRPPGPIAGPSGGGYSFGAGAPPSSP